MMYLRRPRPARIWRRFSRGNGSGFLTTPADARTERPILADETRLQQLLENFFRNAVEHDATGRRSLTLPTTPSNTARRALPRTTRRTARPA